MKKTKTSMRLAALFLCVILVLGLLPTAALAAGPSGGSDADGITPMAAGDPYHVTFTKDAFHITEIGVMLIDGTTPTPVNLSTQLADGEAERITLDGASFRIGTDNMPIQNMVSGYGLMKIATTRQTPNYYFQFASWERKANASSVATLTYEDIEKHAGQTLYLQYRTEGSNLNFPVKAVLKSDGSTLAEKDNFLPGEITTERAQSVIAGLSSPYFFEGAELRRTDGTGNAIPVDYIDYMNGHYYVRTSLSDSQQVAFSDEEWDVYFVYSPAYTLTLTVADSANNSNNLIDGVHRSTGELTYQIPKNGALNIEVQCATQANMKIVNTTNGSTTLFDNTASNFYQKTYTMAFDGKSIQKDQSATITFVPQGNSRTLYYGHYVNNPTSYHGFTVQLGNNALNKQQTSMTISSGNVLKINAGLETTTPDSDKRFMVDTLVLNDNALPLPTGWTWKGTNNGRWTSPVKNYTIKDSAGGTMASVAIQTVVNYGAQGNILTAVTTVTFNQVYTNIEIDRINLAPDDYPGLVVQSIGEGLTTQFQSAQVVTTPRPMTIGEGVYPPHNVTMTITPEFGYYIRQFRMDENDHLEANTDTRNNWWGKKVYPVNNAENAGTYAKENAKKITDAGTSSGYLESGEINFTFHYDWDGKTGGSYYTDGTPFQLTPANSQTLALNSDLEPSTPAGKIFVGWSLTPTNGGSTANFYAPGQVIPRAVIMGNTSKYVSYGSVGEAVINLYPVFQNEGESSYTNYTVVVHTDTSSRILPFTGGLVNSVLDRDLALALSDVAAYVQTLGSNYVLDGARSDSLVQLTRGGGNEFHLYFANTDPVTITFVSKHGFENEGEKTTLKTEQNPGAVMTVPKPKQGADVDATFVGWSITETDTVGIDLADALVPHEPTTYYAIYAPDVTLTFHPWSPENSWTESGTTVTVKSGQSIQDAGGEAPTTVKGLEKVYNGYTFQGWAQGGPYGSKTYSSNAIQTLSDFSGGTTFYAVYEPGKNATITLNANGGTFGNSSDSKQLTGQTVGSVVVPEGDQVPTREGSWVFVGWSQERDDLTGSMSITVAPGATTYYALWLQTNLTVEVNDGELTYNGSEQKPPLTVTWNGQTLTSDAYKAEYANNINAGTATVTVTKTDGGIKGFATFTIRPKDISTAAVEGLEPSYSYTGSQIVPTFTVKDGNAELTAGKDYTLSYGKNINVSEQGTVTVTGIGNYTGQLKKTFNITAPEGALTIAPIPDQLYNGGKKPAALENYPLVVYDQNRRLLTENTDYTVNWPEEWSIGPKTVRITGKGNYTGKTAETTFHVTAASTNLAVAVTPPQAPVGGGQPQITVSVGNQALKDTDYTLSYEKYNETTRKWEASSAEAMNGSDAGAVGMYRITATGKDNSVYRGATGQGVFVRTAVELGQGGLTVTLPEDSNAVIPYDGADHSDLLSELVVKNSTETVKAENYTISITHDGEKVDPDSGSYTGKLKNAGVYIVTVTGKDSVSGTGTLAIYITPRDLNSVQIQFQKASESTPFDSAEYTGSPIAHSFQLVDSGLAGGSSVTLKERTKDSGKPADDKGDANYGSNTDGDYYILPHNHGQHVDAGNYVVTVSGSGNYSGAKTFTFTIKPKTITVNGNDVSLTYGYTQDEWKDALKDKQSAAETQIVTADKEKVTLELYVDDTLNAGQDQAHLHYRLTGGKAGNYRVDIQAKVDVAQMPLSNENIKVTVAPQEHEFSGEAHTPNISVVNQKNNLTLSPATDYEISYLYHGENNEDPTGKKVDALKEVGHYTIVLTAKTGGNYTGTNQTGKFQVTAPTGGTFTVILKEKSVAYNGQPQKPGVTVMYGGRTLDENEYAVAYAGNVNVGTATVTVTGKGSYAALNRVETFTITPKAITNDMVTVQESAGYTGSPITPTVEVTDGGKTLAEGVDYTVSYQRNSAQVGEMVDAASYTVVITGKGNYNSSVNKTFTINKASMGDGSNPAGGFTVRVYPSTGVFDNTDHASRLDLVVTYNGHVLTRSKDYTVSYKDSENQPTSTLVTVGSYTITVTGKGNYEGSASTTYQIVPYQEAGQALKVKLSESTYTYDGTEHEPTVTVTADGSDTPLDSTKDYTVEYRYNVNAGQATVIVTGTGNYQGRTATASFTIEPRDIAQAAVEEIVDQTFTGDQLRPEITVTDSVPKDSTELKLNTDYTVSYGPNVDVGERGGTVTVTGTGNYKGSKQVSFQIVAADIGGGDEENPSAPAEGFTVNVYPSSAPYTGKAHEPAVVVHHNGQLLVKDRDYTVTYQKTNGGPELTDGTMVNAGAYTIAVQGKDNYKGKVEATYTITDAGKDAVVLEIAPIAAQTYTGSQLTPELTVNVVADGKSTKLNDDEYTTSWTGDRTNAGVYIVTVTSTKSGSAGLSATAAFVINPKSVADKDVSAQVADEDLVYDGSAKTPGVTVTYTPTSASQQTLNGADYILVYADNIDAGDTATVTIHGRGNYTGSRKETFSIRKSGSEGGGSGETGEATFVVQVHPATGVFTGQAHHPYIQVVDPNTGRILDSSEYTLSGHENMTAVDTYTITAKASENSNYVGQATATYQITQAPTGTGELHVSLTEHGPFPYNGKAHEPAVKVTFNGLSVAEENYEVTYAQNTDAGTATVTVTGKGNDYDGMTGTVTFRIAPRSITLATVEDIADMVFTGQQLKPTVTVTDSVPDAGTKLTQDKDYTVTYGDNVDAGSNAGSVTITGKGNYEGTMTVYFTILPAGGGDPGEPEPLPASGTIRIAAIPDQTYNGSAHEPTVEVIWESKDGSDTRTLTRDQDYTVKYENNTNVGRATVTVTGIGNYAGLTAQANFNIVAQLLHLDVTVSKEQMEVDAGNPVITVALDDTTLGSADYELTYTLGGETAEDLSAVGVYTITASGKGDYAGAIGSAVFVRLPKDLSDDGGFEIDGVTGMDPEQNLVETTYNGADQKADILGGLKVSAPGESPTELIQGTDYDVTVSYNGGTDTALNDAEMKNAGVYVVTIQGKGTYGSNKAQLVVIIGPAQLTEDNVTVEEVTYNGAEQSAVQSVTGVGEDGTLTEDTHYIVTNGKQTNAGAYQVAVTGQGNYTGTVVKEFVIHPAEIKITGIKNPEIDFGEDFPALTAGTDYTVTGIVSGDESDVTVSLSAPLIAGTHPITATLGGSKAGNYTLAQDENFTLTVHPMSMIPDPSVPGEGDENGDGVKDPDKDSDNDGYIEDENGDGVIETTNGFTVTMSPTQEPFDGKAHTPTVTVTHQPQSGETVTLKEGTDYTVSYLNSDGQPVTQMIAEGKYTVRVSGVNNYKGGFDLTFTITPGTGGADDDKDTDGDGSIEDGNNDGEISYQGYRVQLSPTSGYHNGQPHYPRVTVWYTPDGGTESELRASDYTVTYLNRKADGTDGDVVADMIDVGTYTVRVQMNSPYSGTFDLTYTIQNTPSGGGGGGSSSSYTITAQAGEGGVINPSGRVSVNRNANYTFAITPSEGYRISDVLVDGESVGAVSSYTFKSVRASHTIQAVFEATGALPGVADPDETGVSAWLNTKDHIAYLKGYPGGLFGPNDNMTRAEVAQLFYNLLLDQDVAVTAAFGDVAEDAWYARAVNTLASMGILQGVGGNSFAPERSITRAEFTAIAMRFGKLETGGENIFPDVSPDAWYYDYVVGAARYGWITGYPNGYFGPEDTVTRSEVTAIVNRMLARSADKDYVDSHRTSLTQFGDTGLSHWAYYEIMEATNAHDYTKQNGTENWKRLLK